MDSDTPIPTEKTLHTLSLQEDDGEATQVKQIIDAKYEKMNIAGSANSCDHLSLEEQSSLFTLLTKYQTLFDGTLGRCNLG